ncbi:MBOAT family protein, partial [Myxococcota bacterium]|nr:MBOAT family protein [Myxococcota bacterium]
MNFAEPIFLPFLLIVLVLDRALTSKRRRVTMLLVASCVFYGWWNVKLLPLLFVTAVLDFFLARVLDQTDDPGRRRGIIVLSVVANLGLLGYFKYTNFAISTLNDVAVWAGRTTPLFDPIDVLLPVGISFYTFQSMSYTLDVYRRELKPDPSLPRFLCFVTLFPQLVAGPIVRAAELLPQLADDHENRREPAIFLILYGLFKKVVIADTLGAVLVDPVFAAPAEHSAAALWLAAYGYAFQIFCDFSGYSDIAIGCGRLIGFEFPKNFHAPYLSPSIGDFWRRWHMTLGTWFRDYVYVPLGGNRGTLRRWLFASLAVFLLSGLWHGASYNFVIWGAIHGVLFVAERLWGRWRKTPSRAAAHGRGLGRALRVVLTFHVVTLAWIFFRAQGLGNALDFLRGLTRGLPSLEGVPV